MKKRRNKENKKKQGHLWWLGGAEVGLGHRPLLRGLARLNQALLPLLLQPLRTLLQPHHLSISSLRQQEEGQRAEAGEEEEEKKKNKKEATKEAKKTTRNREMESQQQQCAGPGKSQNGVPNHAFSHLGPPEQAILSVAKQKKSQESDDSPFTFLAILHARLQLTAHPGVIQDELLVGDANFVSVLPQRVVQLHHFGLTAGQHLFLQCEAPSEPIQTLPKHSRSSLNGVHGRQQTSSVLVQLHRHVYDSFWWRIDISMTRARQGGLLGYVTFQDGTLFWLLGPHMSSNGSNASASRASSSSLTDTELMAP
ncbi:MAG: hypothetical protein FRX49_08386 [Trebouxia sp. A1-2]|nr:MAG: hypothetical protein FRX49_08386 [Trebouxia sp. A1-2]